MSLNESNQQKFLLSAEKVITQIVLLHKFFVFMMTILSEFKMVEYKDADHRDYAPYFTIISELDRSSAILGPTI